MKTFVVAAMLVLGSTAALAGGGATGGATEVTQLLNNIQLADSYIEQVTTNTRLLNQYQTMLKNLGEHPTGYNTPNVKVITNNMGKVISANKDIGNTMSLVDRNFANQFQSPLAGSFADKFKTWTSGSNDALRSAMLNAGLQRENFSSDSAALQALVDSNQSADGNLNAIKTLGTINAAQIQESMKLRDLISQQQIATGTYMAAQAAKDQAKQDAQNNLAAPYTKEAPKIGTMKILDWNNTLKIEK